MADQAANQTIMRFSDPVLHAILTQMRTPGGARLTVHEWSAFKTAAVGDDTLDAKTARADFLRRTQGYIHTCYLWSILTFSAYTCATLSARPARRTPAASPA